jgi:hypothetical protein
MSGGSQGLPGYGIGVLFTWERMPSGVLHKCVRSLVMTRESDGSGNRRCGGLSNAYSLGSGCLSHLLLGEPALRRVVSGMDGKSSGLSLVRVASAQG